MFNILLMVVLAAMLVGLLPFWPYSTQWGYYPSTGIFILLILALALLPRHRDTI